MSPEPTANDKDLAKVTIKRIGEGQWKLIILKRGTCSTEVVLGMTARCGKLEECLEQLDQWRKGVIIV